MTKINKQIAESLGIEVPEEQSDLTLPVVVEPHELVRVDNPALPDMADIDKRLLEGEKQLETVIKVSLEQVEEIQEDVHRIEAKNRGRYYEASNMSMQIALEAIKTKISTQMDKKEMRMKEAEFQGKNKKPDAPLGGNTTTNYIFSGSLEDVQDLIKKSSEG